MSKNDDSIGFVNWTARIVAAVGLGFVFVTLILSWVSDLQSETVELYVTDVGVPLLTFAGFLAVYLGFLSQREQNELQKEQLEKQQENFQKDRFESTFFQLLRTQNHIVNDVRVEQRRKATKEKERERRKDMTLVEKLERKKGRRVTIEKSGEDIQIVQMRGRSCFELFYSEFEELFNEKADEEGWGDSECGEEGKVRWVYAKWFADRKSELNHYFNHLSKLISFVHRSDIQDKEFYIDLVIAQMSMPELKLFFYHANLLKDESGHRHLRDVHEVLGEYNFFEQVDKGSLAHDQHYQLNREALGM